MIGLREFTTVTAGMVDGYILYEREGTEENLAWAETWIIFK